MFYVNDIICFNRNYHIYASLAFSNKFFPLCLCDFVANNLILI